MKLITKLEILFWKFAIYLIRKGYGANCEQPDIDYFNEEDIAFMQKRNFTPEMRENTVKEIRKGAQMTKEWYRIARPRCLSCTAKETIDWIEAHIKLISN